MKLSFDLGAPEAPTGIYLSLATAVGAATLFALIPFEHQSQDSFSFSCPESTLPNLVRTNPKHQKYELRCETDDATIVAPKINPSVSTHSMEVKCTYDTPYGELLADGFISGITKTFIMYSEHERAVEMSVLVPSSTSPDCGTDISKI